MLLKCQINTNTKKRIFASYKMSRKGIEILILRFNYFKLWISYNNVCKFVCVDLGF